jgi:hypothetical protein
MMRTPLSRAAVAIAGLLLVVAAAGCAGVATSGGESPAPAGSGAQATCGAPTAGEVRLVVSKDFGTTTSHDVVVPADEGMTVMSLLAANTKLETGYGGSFVTSIDGVESTFGSSGDASDWFYWVDGRMGRTGAGDVELKGGETVWWDFHRWQGAMFIPAALHAFPRPWSRSAVTLAGGAATEETAALLESRAIEVSQAAAPDAPPAGDAVLTATVAQAESIGWLRDLLAQKNDIGIFVEIDGERLYALDHSGGRSRQLTAAAIAAPNPAAELKTLLILLGDDEAAVAALVDRMDPEGFAAGVGVGMTGDDAVPLPDDR